MRHYIAAIVALFIMIPHAGSAEQNVVITTTASIQVSSLVNGRFGFDQTIYGIQSAPLVQAFNVTGPGIITIIASGSWSCGWPTGHYGPAGVLVTPNPGYQYPLQEKDGVYGTPTPVCALFGAFVPATTVSSPGFQPVDGTKATLGGTIGGTNRAPFVGIMPNTLFYIGDGTRITVREPGVIFLGVNDVNDQSADNSGSVTVTIANRVIDQ